MFKKKNKEQFYHISSFLLEILLAKSGEMVNYVVGFQSVTSPFLRACRYEF